MRSGPMIDQILSCPMIGALGRGEAAHPLTSTVGHRSQSPSSDGNAGDVDQCPGKCVRSGPLRAAGASPRRSVSKCTRRRSQALPPVPRPGHRSIRMRYTAVVMNAAEAVGLHPRRSNLAAAATAGARSQKDDDGETFPLSKLRDIRGAAGPRWRAAWHRTQEGATRCMRCVMHVRGAQ